VVLKLCSEHAEREVEAREFSNGQTYLVERDRIEDGAFKERRPGRMVGPFDSPEAAENSSLRRRGFAATTIAAAVGEPVKFPFIFCVIATAFSVGGCNRPADGGSASLAHHGRYVGVGIYPVGQMWSQMVVANASKDTAAAKPNDDEQVVVVVDSNTGELRQCGNLTGYCVGMNPWAKSLMASQVTPVPLAKHAEQLADEAEVATKQ
jgi:hypothetical protein